MRCGIVGMGTRSVEANQGFTPTIAHVPTGIVHGLPLTKGRFEKVPFLDAVLSSKKHKTLRFGLNWVVLGVAVSLPMRPDRYYCLPVLWRCYRKKGQAGHQSRTQLAARMAHHLAESLPERAFWLVGDSAYINSEINTGAPPDTPPHSPSMPGGG